VSVRHIKSLASGSSWAKLHDDMELPVTFELLTSLHSSRPALSVHSAVGNALPCGCQACTSNLSEMTNAHQRAQGRLTRGYHPGASSKGNASGPAKASWQVVYAV